MRYACSMIDFQGKINLKCFKLFIFKIFVMNYEPIKRLRRGRGKTPPTSPSVVFIDSEHRRGIPMHFTVHDDERTMQIIMLCKWKRALESGGIGIRHFFKQLWSLSRLAMHPLNLRTKYCSSTCEPFLFFSAKQQRICKFLC